MLEPGAATSMMPRPRLEKLERRLSIVPAGNRWVEATVTTPSSSVGMSWQSLLMVRFTGVLSSGLVVSVVLFARSYDELPAAAAWTTPCPVDHETALRTASLAAAWSGWSE